MTSREIQFDSHGYACELAREGDEPWRGYVRLPPDHPWVGLSEMDLEHVGLEIGREITWSDERSCGGWWVGFDGVALQCKAGALTRELALRARVAARWRRR